LAGQVAAAETRLTERRGELNDAETRLRVAREALRGAPVTVIAPVPDVPAPAPAAAPAAAPAPR
jgi:hypothetical protein